MQFIVFAAFAMVLSIPEAGPPWEVIRYAPLTWLIALGPVLLGGAMGVACTASVRRKLEREPMWLPSAQARMASWATLIRTALGVNLALSLYLTDWVERIRIWPRIEQFWGLDEILALAPFFVGVMMSWIAIYPADRAIRQVSLELRLWASVPTKPIWSLGHFLSFMVRQNVLIVAVPMIPIVIANDFVAEYGRWMRQATGIPWIQEAVLAAVAGVVFLFAPVMLRYIWHTRILPPSDLRDRLEAMCRRIGLTYRRILIWESDGMVVNAAVMGMFAPVRYILLSDGLLEMMEDDHIEAVFGHEAGHVKHRHLEFYMLFAILSMLIVGGISILVTLLAPDLPRRDDYLQISAMVMIILIWGVGFGLVSRRFEWQADLFGARSVTPPPQACCQPCHVHGTALTTVPPEGKISPVCATAASLFAEGLHRIAQLNGIPEEARSWRHSSIGNRMRLLKRYAYDPTVPARLERSVLIIKVILFVGTLIGLAIGAWIYWPK